MVFHHRMHVFAGTEKMGIFKSSDGGKTWNHLAFDSPVLALAFDDEGKLFASIEKNDFVESDDFGGSWIEASGHRPYNNKYCLRLDK